MNILSLFDGISCGYLALQRAKIPIENYYSYEIDKYAIQVSKARFPQIQRFGDVRVADFSCHKNIDLLIGGSPCFPEGTLVLTALGYEPIENIKVGDSVLTHRGRFKKVTAFGCKTGEILELTGQNHLFCTKEHPIYSAKNKPLYYDINNKKIFRKNLIQFGTWTKSKDMKDLYWATPNLVENLPIPKIKESKPKYDTSTQKTFKINESLFYFIGRWLGDGYVRNTQRRGRTYGQRYYNIVLCDSNDKENELIKCIKSIYPAFRIAHCRTVIKVSFTSKALCEWLVENFGAKSYGKKLPAWIFSVPDNLKQSLLDGYTDSDGSKSKNKIRFSSVSKKLIMGVRTLAETLGYQTGVSKNKHRLQQIIQGRLVNCRPSYTLTISKNQNFRTSYQGHSYYKCRNVIKTNRYEKVYNISVEDDESYIADSIAVHNCQDLSIAKRDRKGLKGDKSSLFWEFARALKEVKPKYFLLENVASMSKNDKEIITQTLGAEPILINSALVSAQHRKRLYWTNIQNITQPKDKNIKLADVLENGNAFTEKSYCVTANIGNAWLKHTLEKHARTMVAMPVDCALRTWPRSSKENRIYDRLEIRKDEKSNSLTSKERDVMVCKPIRIGLLGGKDSMCSRIYNVKGKSVCLSANGGGMGAKTGLYKIDLPDGDYCIRKLTPLECERLQTLPDEFTDVGISNTQRYKCLGNAWTVDVIAHIFSFIK